MSVWGVNLGKRVIRGELRGEEKIPPHLQLQPPQFSSEMNPPFPRWM